MVKIALTDDELASCDWESEPTPPSHPLQVRIDARNVYDLDTGRVVATVNKGYRFFWAHNHVHVCREDWDGQRIKKPDGTTTDH